MDKDSAALRNLDTAGVEKYLITFSHQQPYFPYVIVPRAASVEHMIQTRPMLLLATLTASSGGDEIVQASCDVNFRTFLAKKVIVQGDRSLDLLQGLLVYLAWYHHYLDLKRSKSTNSYSCALVWPLISDYIRRALNPVS